MTKRLEKNHNRISIGSELKNTKTSHELHTQAMDDFSKAIDNDSKEVEEFFDLYFWDTISNMTFEITPKNPKTVEGEKP